jgi:hypothetical protein
MISALIAGSRLPCVGVTTTKRGSTTMDTQSSAVLPLLVLMRDWDTGKDPCVMVKFSVVGCTIIAATGGVSCWPAIRVYLLLLTDIRSTLNEHCTKGRVTQPRRCLSHFQIEIHCTPEYGFLIVMSPFCHDFSINFLLGSKEVRILVLLNIGAHVPVIRS